MLNDITAELMPTPQLNLKERLEAAYVEVKRLVDEMSGPSDGGMNGCRIDLEMELLQQTTEQAWWEAEQL